MPEHPKNLTIQDFRYILPESAVAQYPLENRDAAKLLYYQSGQISDHVFQEIPDLLPSKALLVFNDTKVVQARLLFTKPTGGLIEIFCLEPVSPHTEMQQAMQQTAFCSWQCFVGNAKRWKSGPLHLPLPEGYLQAELQERTSNGFIIKFSWQPTALTFAEILEIAGKLPLPPYLNREAEETDKSRYQTVYAATAGAVAAPTAGLHFTENVLNQLTQQGILQTKVTLHVGAGTFKPVKAAAMEDHPMHAEEIYVSRATILSLQNQLPESIIPVGTTSLRTLESLYWLGVLIQQNPKTNPLHVPQWLAYETNSTFPTSSVALQTLIDYLDAKQSDHIRATTQLLIAPGYQFRLCTGLITNFHQPESTLLLLVSALIGDNWRKVYEHALQNHYRFLSYGDSSLLLP